MFSFQEVRKQNEIEKAEKNVKFCKYFLDFGMCQKQNTCPNRHLFTSNEKTFINHDLKKIVSLISLFQNRLFVSICVFY